MIYLDTSVLVAYYCPEPLSRAAERAARAEVAPSISDLCEVEFASALARKVRARDWIARFEGALKALDALHLVVAAEQGLVLVSADRGLVSAAASRGVKARLQLSISDA